MGSAAGPGTYGKKELPIFPSSHLTPGDEEKILLPPGTELPAKTSGVSKYTRVQAALLSLIRLPVISAPYLVSLPTVPLLFTDKLHKALEYSYLLYLSLVCLSTYYHPVARGHCFSPCGFYRTIIQAVKSMEIFLKLVCHLCLRSYLCVA